MISATRLGAEKLEVAGHGIPEVDLEFHALHLVHRAAAWTPEQQSGGV